MGIVSTSRPSITWKRTPQPVPQYEHVEGMSLKSIRIAPYIIEDFGLNIDAFSLYGEKGITFSIAYL
jgi:hypothetical protein